MYKTRGHEKAWLEFFGQEDDEHGTFVVVHDPRARRDRRQDHEVDAEDDINDVREAISIEQCTSDAISF